MNLSLDTDSVALLREVVTAAVRDLHYEIADTDNPGYKRGLKGRAQALESILDQIPTTG
jgi:hypothetical protein